MSVQVNNIYAVFWVGLYIDYVSRAYYFISGFDFDSHLYLTGFDFDMNCDNRCYDFRLLFQEVFHA